MYFGVGKDKENGTLIYTRILKIIVISVLLVEPTSLYDVDS